MRCSLKDARGCSYSFIQRCSMAYMSLSRFRTTLEVVSSILNWICPECGGRMGGPGKEFKCQGQCQRDWRLIWQQSITDRSI
jgi:tRNA(Ile2) C34 agmatinyltransferase TiaS